MLGINENLREKVAVITSGSGVLCSAMGKELARHGVKVAILNRNQEKGEQLVLEIRELGGEDLAIACNVLNMNQVIKAEEVIADKFGACVRYLD